MLYTHGIEM